jgi:hypothetical protein
MAILILLTAGAQAKGQSAAGTVVVIGKSQSKIVVAADSRATDIETRQYSDHFCKIRGLDKHSVFVAAGYLVHAPLWDGFLEATNSFNDANSHGSLDVLNAAATIWGNRMAAKVNNALAIDFAGSTAALEDNLFFSGSFLGYENGVAAFDQVIVGFDPSTKQANRTLDFEPMYVPMHWGAMGRSETANEVLIDKTDFAKSEQAKWNIEQKKTPVENRDVRWAIRLVELTEKYNPKKEDVGGPVDAVQITPKGVQWVQRKPECK